MSPTVSVTSVYPCVFAPLRGTFGKRPFQPGHTKHVNITMGCLFTVLKVSGRPQATKTLAGMTTSRHAGDLSLRIRVAGRLTSICIITLLPSL